MTSPTTYKLGFPKLNYSVVPMASGAPFTRNPTSSDLFDPKVGGYYKIGTVWPNSTTKAIWMLASITGGTTANWVGISDAASGDVGGPASATDTAIALYNGVTGKIIKNSVGLVSASGVLTGLRPTLPAGTIAAGTAPMKFTAGVNLTTPEAGAVEFDGSNLFFTDSTPTRQTIQKVPLSGGSAATRGSFTFAAGTHAQIATTAIAATSVVSYTITTLGTVTAPQAISTAIAAGVGFTPTSADATDTSVVNWVII